MKKFISILVFFFGLSLSMLAQKNYREEFNGPFKSWANVKTRFGAAGDGKKDDTKAIQMALDSLSTMERGLFNTDAKTKYLVVYLPAGTYRITETLRLVGKIGVSVIGEDPEKTIIKWDGGNNDSMFLSNRATHIKISRITWDANNKLNIETLGLHYKDFNEPKFAPTSVEFSDMIFKGNAAYGISAGTFGSDGTGMMDAEVAIKRCKFIACQRTGILIKGFNALDYWIWDCEFTDCNMGVDCNLGNYHIYQSVFNNSKTCDINTRDALYSSVRDCYSNNSNAFSLDEGASCNAFKRIFQGNVVNGAKTVPIQFHHQGKLSLTDNYFASQPNVASSVDYTSWCKGNYDMLSIENSFKEAVPNNLRKDLPSKIHSIDDRINNKTAKIPAKRKLQPFVPFVKRKIFEVEPGANAAAIQKIINAASALKGQRSVVHFPMGNFLIDKTIEVPAGSDIQIIGDGLLFASILKKAVSNETEFYFFKINGPSYISIKDIQVNVDGPRDKSIAFLFTDIDQPFSQVKMDQIYTKSTHSVYIDKLDYTSFEKNNSFFSNGNTVIGGDKIKSGTGTSKLYCFGGQSAGTHLENNATMVARDCWWEGASRKEFIPLDLSGNGNLTVDGALYSPADHDSGTIINIANFKGNVSLLNMYLSGCIDVKPNSPGLNLLVWNVNNYYKLNPFFFLQQKLSSKIAMLGITTQCFNSATNKCATEDPQSKSDMSVNIPDLEGFINKLTKDDRKARPQPYVNLANGISNIYISRVSVENGVTACLFRK